LISGPFAGGIDAVSKQHDGLPSLNPRQVLLHHLIHHVIKMRTQALAGLVDPFTNLAAIGGGLTFYR
jgi:hypothetical protein